MSHQHPFQNVVREHVCILILAAVPDPRPDSDCLSLRAGALCLPSPHRSRKRACIHHSPEPLRKQLRVRLPQMRPQAPTQCSLKLPKHGLHCRRIHIQPESMDALMNHHLQCLLAAIDMDLQHSWHRPPTVHVFTPRIFPSRQ